MCQKHREFTSGGIFEDIDRESNSASTRKSDRPSFTYMASVLTLAGGVILLPSFLPAEVSGGLGRAWAADECGVAVAGGFLTCNGDGTPATDTSPYGNGINYNGVGFTLDVTSSASVINTTTNNGIGLVGNSPLGDDVVINVADGVDISAASNRGSGIFAQQRTNASGAYNVTINSAANISMTGNAALLGRGSAIFALHNGSDDGGGIFVNVTGGDIITTGANSRGIIARHTGGDILINSEANITTGGDYANGILAWSFQPGRPEANIEVNALSGTINTSGDYAHGILALNRADTGSLRVTSGADITATGANASGIRVEAGGTIYNFVTTPALDHSYSVVITGGTVTGGSGMAAGIQVISTGSGTIDIAAGATIDGSASGIAIRDGDRDGGAVFSVGDGIDEIGGSVTVTTAGTIIGNSILGIDDDIFNLIGGSYTGNIYGDDAVASVNDGNDAFNWTGGDLNGGFYGQNGSDTTLIFGNANFSGTEIIDGGDDYSAADGWVDTLTFANIVASAAGANIINWENVTIDAAALTINDGAFTVGDGTVGTGLTVINGGMLDGDNALVLNGNLTLASQGIFNITGNGAGIYTVNGNLANNGHITSQDNAVGDLITITGDYSGTGTINIDTELGGSGSPTDMIVVNGDNNGAMIFNVTNVGGLGAVTGTGATDGIQIVQVDGLNSGSFSLGAPVFGGVYGYDLTGNGYLQSHILGQAYGYSAVQSVLRDEVSTLWQRAGHDLYNLDGSATSSDSGFWMRGAYSDTSAQASIMVGLEMTNTNLNFTRSLSEIGYQHKLFENGDGYLSAGLFAHYKGFSLSVDDETGANLATAGADGYGAGLSLTWNSQSGFYGDLLGQFTSYDAGVNGEGGSVGNFDATTYYFSAEAGYRFEPGTMGTLIPQAQLVWRGSQFENLSDSNGVSIDWNNSGFLTGRIGMALESDSIASQNGTSFSGYVIANLLHDFDDGSSLTASGTNVSSQLSSTRVELRVGANLVNADNNYSIFAEAGIVRSLSSLEYSSVKGVAGFKLKF